MYQTGNVIQICLTNTGSKGELTPTEAIVEKIKKVDIQDKVFEETYTAHIQSNGTKWVGWIPDVPKVKCEAPTEVVLLKTLEKKLHEALVAEEEAWEKQFEEDVKAGRLDPLAQRAIKNYRDGKCYSIEDLQKLL